MKRILIALVFVLLEIPIADASTTTTIAIPAHRNADGIFLNNELSNLLRPEGELTKLLKSPSNSYAIDIATLEEIEDLADGYQYLDENQKIIDVANSTAAANWLRRLNQVAGGKVLLIRPYGSPDPDLFTNAPKDLEFYQEAALARAAKYFKEFTLAPITSDQKINELSEAFYATYRKDLRALNVATADSEVVSLRLQLAKTLNPELSGASATALMTNLRAKIRDADKKLRIVAGNYTITASKYNLPITVINEFATPISTKLSLRSSNSRVRIGKIEPLFIQPGSQVQVEIPIEVIASGQSRLDIKLTNSNGAQIGQSKSVELQLAVISPLTTWFTTGMAIILLLAAIVQSIRRVKRRKHE